MNKKSITNSFFISLLFLIFLLISGVFPIWFNIVLSLIIFIITKFGLDIFYENREEKIEEVRTNQKRILEKAFIKGQSGAFKGYGFSKENKKWVIKNKK